MKKLAFAVFIAFVLGGCSPFTPKPEKFTETFYEFFDTVTVVSGYSDSYQQFSEAAHLVWSALALIHTGCLDSPENLFELLELCETYTADSGGTFDVTLGAVYALYKDGGEPTAEQLAEASGVLQYDFGAIAKGYALDKAAEQIEKSNLYGQTTFAGTISIGGSVAAIGNKPGTADGAWDIGITSPSGDGIAQTIKLAPGQFCATSGTYERGNHIIDPRTLKPVISEKSLTIVANSGAVTDFLSTALFVENNADLAERYNAETIWTD